MFYQTQTFDIHHIATNGNVEDDWKNDFQIEDGNLLKILSVDKKTAGLYECSGYRNNTDLEYHLAFIHAIDPQPSCAESAVVINPEFPSNSKIAYCYSNYTARWPPIVKTNPSIGQLFRSVAYQEGEVGRPEIEFTVGSCAIINKDASFNCSMNYGAPPSYTIISENTDTSSMQLTTQCSSSGINDDNDNAVFPSTHPLFIDSSTILNCSAISADDYSRASWTLSKSQKDENIIVAENFNIEPPVSDLYKISGFGTYNLEIVKVNEETSGVYQCYGYNSSNSFENYYKAFVSTMSKPFCLKTTHPALPTSSRMAFCHVQYASSWPPNMKVGTIDNSLNMRSYTEKNTSDYFKVGQCGILANAQSSFNCTVNFPAPPESILLDESYDNSSPDFSETCFDIEMPLSEVPKWLLDKCEDAFRLTTLPPSTVPPTTKKPRPSTGAPKNIATEPGSPAFADCTTIDETFEVRSWFFVQSQAPASFAISTNMVVVEGLRPHFEFPDQNEYKLRIKSVSEMTSGLYDCSGMKQVGGDLHFEYYTAFLNVLDEPKCSQDVHTAIVDDKKLIYCSVKYAADWIPTINVTVAGVRIPAKVWNKFAFSLAPVYSEAGSCTMIDKSANNYGCVVKFDSPPSEIIFDDYYDKDAPDMTRSCDGQSDLNTISQWLKEECLKEYGLSTLNPPTSQPTTKTTIIPSTTPSQGHATAIQLKSTIIFSILSLTYNFYI
ncbi:DgyrCDS9127 [Dimorphilus gyrociliatus]|uniref:DgyrCDS9127 n=1 Tax=Dimorphilus gyrociliatus TaxID=2664684 RepID=A0A7I8VW52_9ANNE|nr:DgyrCDS9127 [Dimorphilus gyrociliatus]